MASGRYLYVLFCCQQAAEKAVKGIIAERTSEMPPRIHHLARLAEAAGLECTENRLDFMRKLSSFYFQTRYPEEILDLARGVSADLAAETMRSTEELVEWLESTK